MSLFDKWFTPADDHAQLIASVQVGEMCRQWLGSDVGRYIIGMAEQYEVDVMRELATTKPDDKQRIIQLQERVKVPALLLQWLDDAISDGEMAQYQLENED